MGKHAPLMVAEPQLNMFAKEEKKLREELQKINIDDLTPLEALKKLDELKKGMSE